ncbi:MAG TPA: hypothetical protein VH988_13270 [Thermoanaerobaculia bacterium]|jgi:hypothetical protein|nr:hypothetical protein [Thermoanaerobaculia bacterium]
MAESPSVKFLGLLRVLLRHGVDFFVVGGVAAQLEGAPILTLDLDILFDKAPENLSRLLSALHELKARYRDPAGRHIEPDIDKLKTHRMHLLLTELGALDLLGSIGNGLTYQDLAGRTVVYALGQERVHVLELAAVIEMKRFANRDKDRAVLPVLQRTLEMKNKPS